MNNQGVTDIEGHPYLCRIELLNNLPELVQIPAHIASPGWRVVLHDGPDADLFVERCQVFELSFNLSQLFVPGPVLYALYEAQPVKLNPNFLGRSQQSFSMRRRRAGYRAR